MLRVLGALGEGLSSETATKSQPTRRQDPSRAILTLQGVVNIVKGKK